MEQRSGSKKRELNFVLLCLLVCVAVTGVLLADRLSGLTANESDIIALVPSEEMTTSEKTQTGEKSTVKAGAVSETAKSGQKKGTSGGARDAKSGVQIGDDSQVWRTDTEIELFHVQYENDQKAVSVSGSDGDEVIAPGTGNDYTFWLKNPAGTAADYKMEVEAYLTPGEAKFPVKVRMKSYEGDYLVGSEKDWEDALSLNGVSDKARLGSNQYAGYTMEWQWPFESEDENGDPTEADRYDTMLGNQAMDEEMTFTVMIRTTTSLASGGEGGEGLVPVPGNRDGGEGLLSETDPEEKDHRLLPKTGDTTHIMIYILLFAGAGGIMILLILSKRRRKKA